MSDEIERLDNSPIPRCLRVRFSSASSIDKLLVGNHYLRI